MEKITQVRIYNSDLKDFLIQKGYILDNDYIAKIDLSENRDGIILIIEHPTLGEKQKEFMNMLVKDMDISVRLIDVIKKSAYGTKTVEESLIYDYLRGSDLFKLRKERDWLRVPNSDKKIIDELNRLYNQYNLPPLER